MSDYQDLTDCPICSQLATDRDDALRDAEALRSGLYATEELIADLRLRLIAAETALEDRRNNDARGLVERSRLSGKLEGVRLALDYLRSYS